MSSSGTQTGKAAESRVASGRATGIRDPRVVLRSPVTAVLLAILFPGAGHWYQGRRFKATIFTVCIMTVFVWGLVLGNWQPVYSQIAVPAREHDVVQMERSPPRTEYSFGFIAQAMMGGPILPALIQQTRFRSDPGAVEQLDEPFTSEFQGFVELTDNDGSSTMSVIDGTLNLAPLNPDGGRVVTGELTGKLRDGTSVEVSLGGSSLSMGRRVFGSPYRHFRCAIVSSEDNRAVIGRVEGNVRRSFFNWFMAPRDDEEMDRLHGKLNTRFDIACVFTWIAGLLNLLVIWDAADGPAYGYGDEEEEPGEPPASS